VRIAIKEELADMIRVIFGVLGGGKFFNQEMKHANTGKAYQNKQRDYKKSSSWK